MFQFVSMCTGILIIPYFRQNLLNTKGGAVLSVKRYLLSVGILGGSSGTPPTESILNFDNTTININRPYNIVLLVYL